MARCVVSAAPFVQLGEGVQIRPGNPDAYLVAFFPATENRKGLEVAIDRPPAGIEADYVMADWFATVMAIEPMPDGRLLLTLT